MKEVGRPREDAVKENPLEGVLDEGSVKDAESEDMESDELSMNMKADLGGADLMEAGCSNNSKRAWRKRLDAGGSSCGNEVIERAVDDES